MLGQGGVRWAWLHIRLDGVGLRLAGTVFVQVWLALVGRGKRRSIEAAIWKSPTLFGCTQKHDGNRLPTRAAVISQLANMPTSSSRPPTTHPEVLFL